jgi:predicted ABC-type ATPase
LKNSTHPQPKCIVIAGPNGSGKTTFALEFLFKELDVSHFINADLIASGLSPLKPELAAISAGRIVLTEIERLVRGRENFSFESTLSGRTHVARLTQMKTAGYRIEIVFLKIASPQLALRRIAARVRQGGHHIPREDVLRRFERSWANFSAI